MSNDKQQPAVLQPQVSATVRFFTAVGVCVVLSLAWIGAEHESREAVQAATVAISHTPAPATHPVVEVAGRRPAPARRS